MINSYLGILSREGLDLYYPEGEHTATFLLQRLRRQRTSLACCVWFVLDDESETALQALLAADLRGAAWEWVQDSAREVGRFLPDQNLSTHCGDAS